jgi:hypothetical protein
MASLSRKKKGRNWNATKWRKAHLKRRIPARTGTVASKGLLTRGKGDRLLFKGLFGAESYDQLRSNHKGWIEAYLVNGLKRRQEIWADSIAAGSKSFVERVKSLLGFK